MSKPVLLTVDDDPEVLRAIERDLRGHYAQNYRVMRADSGDAGLATLRELKARNNPVALVLDDQRSAHSLLFDEAVGSSGGKVVSGDRRSFARLVFGVSSAVRRNSRAGDA